MSFRNSVVSEMNSTQRGENGMTEYTNHGVGSDLLALSQIVRGGNTDSLVNSIIAGGQSQDIADFIILIFATRNTRGGKGEKRLAYDMFLTMYSQALPETSLSLLELFPHYGYWKDLLLLIKLINEKTEISEIKKNAFFDTIVKIMSDQLTKDMMLIDDTKKTETQSSSNVSLLAKWLPREGSSLDKSTGIVNALSNGLFASSGAPGESSISNIWQSKSKKMYRKTIAKITSYLALPEVLLASHREEEIQFARVASRATMLLRRVFLNRDSSGEIRSDNPKRIKLARRFVDHAINHGLKGSQVMPHEIVRKIMRKNICKEEELVLDCQWQSLRSDVVNQMKQYIGENDYQLARFVPLSDVSGSMHGIPMEVSIALGILLAELTHPAFEGMVLTFETKPRWHIFEKSATIVEKVNSLMRAPWGGSTDFVAAYRLILEAARKHKLDESELPSLIVFSDMQFDEAYDSGSRQSETVHDIIKREFENTAMTLGWKSMDPPPIVFWNLRNTGGHPVTRNTSGTVMLSGFSPSLLKLIMNGNILDQQEIESVEMDGTMKTTKVSVSPEEILRNMLDDPLYDPVRAILDASTEGQLANYKIKAEKAESGFELL